MALYQQQQKKRTTENSPTISPQNLLNHYSKFFFEKNELNAEQKLIEISASEKYNSYTVPENPPMFTLAQIEFIIKEFKESNVAGNDSLTYSFIKNATTPTFKIFLLKFFNYFITLNKIPNKLNQSIIKPIIKDQKKNPTTPIIYDQSLYQTAYRKYLKN